MDRRQRFLVFRGYPYAPTSRDLFKSVTHLLFQALERRNTGRHLIVDEHRCAKITGGKHDGYMGEMHADLIAAPRVLRVVSGHLDRAAVSVQPEMVCRL